MHIPIELKKNLITCKYFYQDLEYLCQKYGSIIERIHAKKYLTIKDQAELVQALEGIKTLGGLRMIDTADSVLSLIRSAKGKK